ncbi:MAG: hypothetical protein EPN24_01615 [Candidatus Methanoperedens sp.]|nr:MAG: hypothetical protein EPN24_01615 [Candidatus Methanoperedens sp.]
MIISRLKEFKDILKAVKEQNIFIIGCGKCATKQHVGGEPEVLEMKKRLRGSEKNVVGWTILSSACIISSWDEVLSQDPEIEKAEALLVMSCGGGVSVLSANAKQLVYPALDTESLGGVCRDEVVKELCGICGDCDIQVFGGLCPVGQCPKGMQNGPCGGSVEGKCEVDERKCVWDEIQKRLELLGRLEVLKDIHEPKDHSKRRRRE